MGDKEIYLNFGVRYDIWKLIYLIAVDDHQKFKEFLDDKTIEHLNGAILSEKASNVIIGYSGQGWIGRGNGILSNWIKLAQICEEIYYSIINHDLAYVYEEVYSILDRISDINEKFQLIKNW